MLRKPHYIALIVVVVLTVVVLKLPSSTVAKLKLAISGMFLPLFGLAGSTHEVAEKTGNTLLSRRELLRQNELLRRENQQLRIHAQQAEEIARENARLRQMAGLQKQLPWRVKVGRIITHDPSNWWRSMQIDLGSRDGVCVNAPVMAMDASMAGPALVGRVQAVGETRSQVILLGDPNLKIAASIEITPQTSESGIVMSSVSSPQENGLIDLGFLSGNSAVRPGQIVRTSGDGGVFPKGIPIGKVVDLRVKDYGLSTEARVKLFANLSALEEVWVKLPDAAAPQAQGLRVDPSPVAPKPTTPATKKR